MQGRSVTNYHTLSHLVTFPKTSNAGATSHARVGLHAPVVTTFLLTLYLLSGIIGHDPWKQDEAYTFGMVLNILETGDWIVPTLAGQPFMEKPPLFYIVAAFMANAFSPWLALHDGARLAAVTFMALGVAFTGAAARSLYGALAMPRAALLLVACFGLLLHAHEMITDTALFAGFAVAIYGLTWAARNPLRAGACLGTGIGIGFMAKGLVEPAMIGLTCLVLPVVSPIWRTRGYAIALCWTALFSLPWLLIWPAALYTVNPEAFATWFWTNNFGRFTGSAHLGADTESWYYTRVLPWFTFPAGPIAILTILKWMRTRKSFDDSSTLLLIVVTGSTLVILTTAATARSLYALPLLIPLSILASRSVDSLPSRLSKYLSGVFGLVVATIAVLVWSIWLYGLEQGHPPQFQLLLAWLPGDFRFEFHQGFFGLALVATLLWMYVWLSRRARATALHRWVAGVTMVWAVTMSLCLPWIDRAKSFREPFSEIAALIPQDACVAGTGLGEPQRGMLHYFAGLVTTPPESADEFCDYLIVQTNRRRELDHPPPPGWVPIWRGGRAGEANEQFTLYERSELADGRHRRS